MPSYKDKVAALQRAVVSATEVCPRAVNEIRHLRTIIELGSSGSTTELYKLMVENLSAESKSLLGVGTEQPNAIINAITEVLNVTLSLEVSSLSSSLHDLNMLLPGDLKEELAKPMIVPPVVERRPELETQETERKSISSTAVPPTIKPKKGQIRAARPALGKKLKSIPLRR